MLTVTLTLLLILFALLWSYSKHRHSYWASRGIHGPPPKVFLGNFKEMKFPKYILKFFDTAYMTYCEEKFFGVYELLKPSLIICDPELIRQVLIKDFDYFTDRRDFRINSEEYKWFNEMISNVRGESWKKLRATLSPTFSSGKIKNMFSIVKDQANNFIKHCDAQMKKFNKVDLKKSCGLFTMDVISSSAFGIQCDSLIKENPEFVINAERIFNPTKKNRLKTLLIMSVPELCRKLGINLTNDTWNFFKKVSAETLASRRSSSIKRGDFLDLLLEKQELQKESFDKTKEYRITDSTILGESIIFLLAGYDTTANVLGFTCFFMARHPEYQRKLRDEMKSLFTDSDSIDYHELMEAKYLDACISETLRIACPLAWVERKCVRDYQLPNTSVKIPQGMMVRVPVWGIHHNPKYWSDPMDYKPERFLPENKNNILSGTYLPFGLGPRSCIAMRFALMEIKVCLSKLIMTYDVSLAPGCGEFKPTVSAGVTRPAPNSASVVLHKI